jgi:hypothetical protein
MRTVLAGHELLPKGLVLESLSVETGHVINLGGIRREEVHLPALWTWFLPGA